MRALSFPVFLPVFILINLLIGMMVTNGCAPFVAQTPTPIIDDQARQLLQQISAHNAFVDSFKGLGQITIQSEKQRLQARLVWMGEVPDKLRLQILSPTGQPFLAMSTDGTTFYFLEYGGDGRFMKRAARRVSLEQIIGIPIPIKDIVYLLAGRIPLRPYVTADLSITDTNRRRLVLGNNQGAPVEMIHFNPETGLPEGIEFYDGDRGRLRYRVRRIGAITIDGSDIPETIILEAEDDTFVSIAINRYWVNETVLPEQFVLTPPPE